MRPATEARIQAAIHRLGYVPGARLPDQKSGAEVQAIALVIPEMDNMFYSGIADHVAAEAERRGLLVLLCSTRNQRVREESYLDLLGSGTASGLLYLGSRPTNARLAAVIESGMPVVVLDEPIRDLPPVDRVVMDNYAGAYQATSHLLMLGHTRIAFVSGPRGLVSVQERWRGYRDALAKVGIDAGAQIALSGPFTEQFGMSAMPHLFVAPETPTAVFAASDPIALGLLAASEAHGVEIPELLSLVGFDDMRFAEYVRPRLTTVHSPIERLAQLGVEMLVDRMSGRGSEPRTEVLPVSLVTRGSTASPRHVRHKETSPGR